MALLSRPWNTIRSVIISHRTKSPISCDNTISVLSQSSHGDIHRIVSRLLGMIVASAGIRLNDSFNVNSPVVYLPIFAPGIELRLDDERERWVNAIQTIERDNRATTNARNAERSLASTTDVLHAHLSSDNAFNRNRSCSSIKFFILLLLPLPVVINLCHLLTSLIPSPFSMRGADTASYGGFLNFTGMSRQ